jgi:LmbE family N-acetylglucosaminyl deacetylase
MLRVNFEREELKQRTILCLGSHSDDIEIGCGGTILRLLDELPNTSVIWVVFGSNAERGREASESANLFLQSAARKRIIIKEFRDGFFPYLGGDIKEYFEEIKQEVFPDLIFTHYRDDLHQDHRLISELTWNTFRNHLILEYETPKYDADLGSPNFFVHLSEAVCDRKVDHLLSCFKTQRDKHWFTRDVFLSILRIRGVESGASGKYAEAFYCRKVIY